MKKPRKRQPAAPAPAPPPAAPKTAPGISRDPRLRVHVLVLLGLWLAALAVYSNSFRTGMPFDNSLSILANPRVQAVTSQNLRLIFDEDYWYPATTVGLYRPLTTLSFLFNYAVLGNGARAFGYHVVNFLMQAVNIALVYWLGLLLLEEVSWAWLLAALWTLHPLLTESITNIVGRADEMAGLGVLAGLLCHAQASAATGSRRRMWLAGVAICAAIAIFAKESGVVLVAVMLCYDLAYGKGAPFKPRMAGYLAMVPSFALFFALRQQMLDRTAIPLVLFVDNPLVRASQPAALMTAFKVIGKYLWLYLWPMRLSSDYSYNQIPVAVDAAGMAALAICLAAAWAAFRAWRRGPKVVCFAILFFFATLAPTSNVLLRVGSIMAERWMYLPSLGLALLVVWGLGALARRFPSLPRRGLVAAALAICLAWGIRAFIRNFDWQDDLSLWESADRVSPESCKPSSAVSNLLATAAHPSIDRAISDSERSLAILDKLSDEDSFPRPWAVAGMCYRLKGDLLVDPRLSLPWYRKSLAVLLRARRIDQAGRDQFIRLNLAAGKPVYQSGLGLLYLELGRIQRRLSLWQDAVASLDYGRVLDPIPEFAEEKSQVFEDMRNHDLAAVALLEGMMVDPRSQRLANRIVQLYKRTASQTCAIETQGSAISFNPQCPMVHEQICQAAHNIAVVYRNSGKVDVAREVANRAVLGQGCPAAAFQQ